MGKKVTDFTAVQKGLLLFTQLLFSGKRQWLSELAEQIQCSKPTITRLMDGISSIAEIESGIEKGRRWYQLRNLPGTPHIGLTCQEVENLALCRDLLERLLPEEVGKTISDSIAKISTLMPGREKRAEVTARRAKRVVWGGVDNSQGFEHLECLRKAVVAQTVCEVIYRDVEHRFRERDHSAPVTYLFIPVRVTCEDDALSIEGWKVQKGAVQNVLIR